VSESVRLVRIGPSIDGVLQKITCFVSTYTLTNCLFVKMIIFYSKGNYLILKRTLLTYIVRKTLLW